MTVVFSGSKGPQQLGEFTVDIPNPAEQIRNEGLRTLKGWKEKAAYERQRSAELIQALRQNQQIESDYRRKAFELENQDNKRVVRNILHNMKVEKKNIQVRSENQIRKQRALFDIIGAGAQAGIALDNLADKRAKEKVKPVLQTLGSTFDPLDSTFEQFAGLEKFSQLADESNEEFRELLGKKGLKTNQIDEIAGYSRKERRHFLEGAAMIERQNMPRIIAREKTLNNIILPPELGGTGEPTNLAALEAEARVSNNAMTRNRLAFGYQFFDQILAERYNETAFGGDLYNKHIRPSYLDYKTKTNLEIERPHSQAAEGKAVQRQVVSRLIQPFNFHYQAGGKSAGDLSESWKHTLEDWVKLKPKSVGKGEWLDRFENMIVMGYKQGLISDAKIDALNAMEYTPSDWKGTKREKETIKWGKHNSTRSHRIEQKIAPTRQENIEAEHKAIKLKQKEDENFANAWLKQRMAGPPEQRTRAALTKDIATAAKNQTFTPGRLRAMSAIIKEDYSFFDFNAKGLKETVARRKLDGEFTLDWINKQEVSDVQKEIWRNDLKESGGSAPTKAEYPALYEQLKAELDGISGDIEGKSQYWGQFGPDAHYSVIYARGTARADYLRRRQENLNHKDIKDLPYEQRWRAAGNMAASQFEQEWQDGLAGKGKYAFSKQLEGGKKTMPFFRRHTTEQFHGPQKLEEARTGLATNSKYLSLPTTKMIKDKRLVDVVTNGASNPRVLYELYSKNRHLFGSQREVLQQLVDGYNGRLPEGGTPLKLPEPTETAKELGKISSLLPSYFNGPPDENSIEMGEVLIGNGGNWAFNNRSPYAELIS